MFIPSDIHVVCVLYIFGDDRIFLLLNSSEVGFFYWLAIIFLSLQGPTLKVWYGVLDKKFGSLGKTGTLKKVFVDQAFFAPSFIVVLLTSLGVLQGKPLIEIKEQIQRDYTDILIAGWMVGWVSYLEFETWVGVVSVIIS